MLTTIITMTAVTSMYVLLTALLWKRTQDKKLSVPYKVFIGLIYGLCSVLSTHFSIDYSQMLLNVRDMGPLSAGLFFDPMSGIIAGLIGGIERYIAGTYWGIGSYTRIACSVSTCLAGIIAAVIHIYIFKRKKPSAIYAFFTGAVIEVFHMYVVFITHRDDMSMAFYVVRTCAPWMISFTALGMVTSANVLKVLAHEWKNPFRKLPDEETPVSHRFQFWLFAVTVSILILNLIFTYSVQTQTAMQNAREMLDTVSGDVRQTYGKLRQTEESSETLAGETARLEALVIAEAIDHAGGFHGGDGAFLERIRSIYHLVAIATVNQEGNIIAGAGDVSAYSGMLSEVLDGSMTSQVVIPSASHILAGAHCGDGMVQVVLDRDRFTSVLNLASLNESLVYFHVCIAGTLDMIQDNGEIAMGDHKGTVMSPENLARMKKETAGSCFEAEFFGQKSLCRYEKLDTDKTLLLTLPVSEVYADRDEQTFESAFSAIILFSVIYVLISMLVQYIVVNNLQLVNASLGRITQGNLNEVVSVRKSSEFASLSDDINQTVDVLKGYIAAAEKRIEQELEFARTIQEASLPKNFTFPRQDFEIYATMDPAKEVGGDFYDFFLVGMNKLALVIADVSGKGIPAALFMMRAKTNIHGLAESGLSPAEILYCANNTLCEGNDAEMFVTAWLGIIDLKTGKMQCANAGHEYPLLMPAGGDFEYVKDKHGLALAAMKGMRYKEYELQLNPGDRLFVYTDGIPEAIDENVKPYGPERLVRILNKVKNESISAVLPAVREDIAAFTGDADQFDDITMLGLVYHGAGNGSNS